MIKDRRFECRPWAVHEKELDLDHLGQTESIFALSNGHIGWRANLDEGEPHAISGAYLNGVYEEVPLPVAEAAYGYPEAGQVIVNVTDGKIIRLLVDDEPFDVRYGNLKSHERTLDFRSGLLTRAVEWESPNHRTVRVRSTRMVSLTHRAIAAILYEVETVGGVSDVVLQSELVANEPVVGKADDDPRSGDIVERPLQRELAARSERGAVLIHTTRKSDLRVAAAMEHVLAGPRGAVMTSSSEGDKATVTVTARLEPHQRLRLIKFVAYGWSSARSVPALRAQVEGG